MNGVGMEGIVPQLWANPTGAFGYWDSLKELPPDDAEALLGV
jgi:hypothetical protein